MAKQDEHKASGDNGRWFLEAVGAVPAAPTPSETVAALESENAPPDVDAVTPPESTTTIATTTFDGNTGTSTILFEPVRSPPQEELDEAYRLDDPSVLGNEPEGGETEMAAAFRRKRRFRLPIVAFVVFLVTVAVLVALWLPAALRQDALTIGRSTAESALSLREILPTSQMALNRITDPESPTDDLSDSIPIISELDSQARDLATAASAPLPRQLPLLSNDAATQLEPLLDSAQIQAAQASDISRRLGYAYVYRTSIPLILAMGDLLNVADVQEVDALSVSLASSLVDDSGALADLPDAAMFASLNAATRAAVARYAAWQEEYLAALSAGDESAASALITEIQEVRSGLATALLETLAEVRLEIDQQIVELAGDLEVLLSDLSQL